MFIFWEMHSEISKNNLFVMTHFSQKNVLSILCNKFYKNNSNYI